MFYVFYDLSSFFLAALGLHIFTVSVPPPYPAQHELADYMCFVVTVAFTIITRILDLLKSNEMSTFIISQIKENLTSVTAIYSIRICPHSKMLRMF